MSKPTNPFEYDAAPNLAPELLVEWFIEDHNFSRFVESSRNVLINGERGSGKSMALIYNSLVYQKLRQTLKSETFPPSYVGIYVPCNTALTHKEEYRLLPEVEQAILSEHNLAYGIGAAIAKDFSRIADDFSREDQAFLIDEFAYLTGVKPTENKNPFGFLQRAIRDRIKTDQLQIASGNGVELSFEISSFYTLILPILTALKQTTLLQNTHLSLLIDDAHDLNPYQRKLLNSWLGYRDHSVFSFKVAIAGIHRYDMRTAFGGTILEGHDYITIDLEQPYQNKESGFGKFARDVVAKRLKNVGIELTIDEFFPESVSFRKEMDEYEKQTKKEAINKGVSPDNSKAINDYVYKYARARYFQERPAKANKPVYAGFDTLVHLSTGVIRHLLVPCYWMFEALQSNDEVNVNTYISSEVQSKIIHERSEKLWEFIRNKLETQVEGCGKTEAEKLRQLLTKLAEHFRYRLLNHKSEPRVLTFSISGYEQHLREELEPILHLAQKAQLLYVRSGPAKDGGGREDFYTPNRMLWPEYSLDVVGQHGRASLKAVDLINATQGRSIPTNSDDLHVPKQQGGLFDE
ncbi:hypothetical protein [Rhodoferax ferrireducens]|uniref:ORC-CDC6 family AAA ATPase n=1 Tax=Rhodoferax ferrireducens TaxID=192843 RepID=UPI003BB66833